MVERPGQGMTPEGTVVFLERATIQMGGEGV